MKGFIHIIEVSFAILILVFSVWLSLSSINVKVEWSDFDLIKIGENAWKYISIANKTALIFSNKTAFINEMEKSLSEMVNFGMYIKGLPKPYIRVGCANCSDEEVAFAESIFSPSFYNNRWVNFSVRKFTFLSPEDVKLYGFDIIVFINFTNFDENSLVQRYLENNGKIIAITKIKGFGGNPNSGSDLYKMDETFSLRNSPNLKENYQRFSSYEPLKDSIPKYFLAFGFDVKTTKQINGKYQGVWRIWLNATQINITQNKEVEIEGVGRKKEGEIFILNTREKNPSLPDMKFVFKIKKVFEREVFIQPLNHTFIFYDYSEPNEVKVIANPSGRNVLISKDELYSLSVLNTTTNRALWISYFPESDEYRALVKAIAASMANEFVYKTYFGTPERVVLFFPLPQCCDIPEVGGVYLFLGYKY